MTAPVLSGLRFLIVEDDAANAEMLRCVVESMGARVSGLASSSTEAFEIAEASTGFDVALVDYLLKEETALAFIKQLEARKQPYVLVTGAMPNSLPDVLTSATIVTKPFKIETLVNGIARALQKHSELNCALPSSRITALKRPPRKTRVRLGIENFQEAAE